MKYLLVGDVHGVIDRHKLLISYLKRKGWKLDNNLLYHDTDFFIHLGDMVDGEKDREEKHNLDFIVQMTECWQSNAPVFPLLGNHDIKLRQNLIRNAMPNQDWSIESWLEAKKMSGFILGGLVSFLEKYQSPIFDAYHAYNGNTLELTVYGPNNNGNRNLWYKTEQYHKPQIFGHYHEKEVRFGSNICLDLWTTGVMAVAIVDAKSKAIEIELVKE